MIDNIGSRKWFPFLVAMTVTIFSVCFVHSRCQGGWLEKGSDLLNEASKISSQKKEFSNAEVGAGLKEALRVGTGNVVNLLGMADGFNLDPKIHIPLPDTLGTVKKFLEKAGMSKTLDELELKLNRAAELAVPKAKTLFEKAISEMSFSDVMNIFNGPDDAATRFFQNKMTPDLVKEMHPIIENALNEAGAVHAFERVMGEYKTIPFVPDVKADLTDYTVEKGLDGIFYYVAQEEAAIRNNPAARTTDLLKKVFGP